MKKPIKVRITDVFINPKLKHAALLMQDYVVGGEQLFFTKQKGLKVRNTFKKTFYDNQGNDLGYIVGTITEIIKQEESDY